MLAMDIVELELLALAADRSAGLAALMPGTAEHDYWRGVFLQHAGRLAEVDEILAGWTKRKRRRDDTLSQLDNMERGKATKAQKAYHDSCSTSKSQMRNNK